MHPYYHVNRTLSRTHRYIMRWYFFLKNHFYVKVFWSRYKESFQLYYEDKVIAFNTIVCNKLHKIEEYLKECCKNNCNILRGGLKIPQGHKNIFVLL